MEEITEEFIAKNPQHEKLLRRVLEQQKQMFQPQKDTFDWLVRTMPEMKGERRRNYYSAGENPWCGERFKRR